MLQVCSQCGAVSNQQAEVCPFCDFPFDAPSPAKPTSADNTEEPEWRREVARRLEVYRARRHEPHGGGSQTALPFSATGEAPEERIATAVAPRTIARLRPAERVEIRITQPQLDFSVVENFSVQPAGAASPVAGLETRGWAALLDATAILGVFAGFLEMFRSMGGQVGHARLEFMVYGVSLFLIYALYFTIFTLFSGVTPGMQALGLTLAGADGEFPESQQLAWRSIGYVLSGGTLLLGFLWALWDEEHLTWQDRISRTYISALSTQEGEEESQEQESVEERSKIRMG